MKLSELTPEQMNAIRSYRYDRIVEKHEGPERWSSLLRYAELEFLAVEGYDVLLPLDRTHHPNLTVLRCIPSADEGVLTIFLKDTTYFTGMSAGFLTICERVPGESWFLALVYHEWFLTDYRVEEDG